MRIEKSPGHLVRNIVQPCTTGHLPGAAFLSIAPAFISCSNRSARFEAIDYDNGEHFKIQYLHEVEQAWIFLAELGSTWVDTWRQNFIQIGPKIDKTGGCVRIAYITMYCSFRFLDF